jgi:hypothetical protein
MDLLELLDHNASTNANDKDFGLNPECYASGLLREAIGQLAGLKRRKKALEMLGTAIERGLAARITTTATTITQQQQKQPPSGSIDNTSSSKPSSLKRGRDQSEMAAPSADSKKKPKVDST